MVHKKRHYFLVQFSMPFHTVWSVLMRVLAQKTTFWLVEILWQPIRSFYSMVFEAKGLYICVPNHFEPKVLARNSGRFFMPKFHAKIFQAEISCWKFWDGDKFLAQNFLHKKFQYREYFKNLLHLPIWVYYSVPTKNFLLLHTFSKPVFFCLSSKGPFL